MKRYGITGIVACGGQSSRMGQDKSLLAYHRKPQRYYVADMIRPFCDQVYLSLNAGQTETNTDYQVIRDEPRYENGGPMTALLSAAAGLRGVNILLIGCDYPLLTARELQRFLESIANGDSPKVFYNVEEGFYEPLLGYYPSALFPELEVQYSAGGSLQQLLRKMNCDRYLPQDNDCMRSADDEQDYKAVSKIIANQKRLAGNGRISFQEH